MGIKQDFFYIFLLLLRQFFSLKKHCIPFNGIDRGLKLMRNIGDKIHLQYFCCTKLFCHHIKTLVRFSNFCDTAVRFQVLFKISLRNFLHCFTESGNCARLADFCIITEDNSRGEPVEHILADIRAGLRLGNPATPFAEIPDRRQAIYYALDHAQPGDIIAILGKGHETTIERGGIKEPFVEREIVEEYWGR